MVKALSMRPQDSFGNVLGPGFGRQIQAVLSAGMAADTVTGPVADLGNGTYVITLLVPPDSDPRLTLTVLGAVLFEGALSELPEDTGQDGADRLWVLLAVGALLLLVVAFVWLIRRR